MVIAGLALLQAQRLITQNDIDLVLEREILVDCSGFQIFANRLRRSPACLSGHVRWDPVATGSTAAGTTFNDLFEIAETRLEAKEVTLEPYDHPLNTQAACSCGRVIDAVGTNWAPAPMCPGCGQAMEWRTPSQLTEVARGVATRLGIGTVPLERFGLPEEGAMFVARAAEKPALRLRLL